MKRYKKIGLKLLALGLISVAMTAYFTVYGIIILAEELLKLGSHINTLIK